MYFDSLSTGRCITNFTAATMNSPFEGPLSVGFHENTYPCLDNSEEFLNCTDIRVKTIVFWLQLFWKGEIELLVYPVVDGGNQTIFTDLKQGRLHVAPDWVVEDLTDFKNYSIINKLHFSNYYFYTKQLTIEENGDLFLFSPFRWNSWVLFFVTHSFILALLLSLNQIKSLKCLPHYAVITSKLSEMNYLLAGFGLVLYSSKLMALLSTSSSDVPFKDLLDLSKQLANGGKVLYLESNATSRYRYLIAEHHASMPFEFQMLSQTIKQNPNSFKFISNVREICQLLSVDGNAVYFSFDTLMDVQCSDYCFWKYHIGQFMESNAVTRSFPLLKDALIFQHPIDSYLMNTMRISRLVRSDCMNLEGEKFELSQIGMQSLAITVYLFIIGLILSVFVLALELHYMQNSDLLHLQYQYLL